MGITNSRARGFRFRKNGRAQLGLEDTEELGNLLNKLNINDPLRKAIINGQKDDLISYILINQKVDVKENFIVKTFPN